jgi:hypothetical protein
VAAGRDRQGGHSPCNELFAFARESNDMARFWKNSWDWCHICGTRTEKCVEIAYPTNAEHQFLGARGAGSKGEKGKFLRICADCGETIVKIGNGEIDSADRNNPALVSRHLRRMNRYEPDAN